MAAYGLDIAIGYFLLYVYCVTSLDFDFAVTSTHGAGILILDLTCSSTGIAFDLLFRSPVIRDFYLTSTRTILAGCLLFFRSCTLAVWTCNLLSHTIHPFHSLAEQGNCCLDVPLCVLTKPYPHYQFSMSQVRFPRKGEEITIMLLIHFANHSIASAF